MNVLGFNIKVSRPKKVREVAAATVASQLWADSGDTGPVLSNAYQQVVWVYRAINAIAEQVAYIPWRFSKLASDGQEVLQSGPLVDFYSRPHPNLDKFQYWELRVIWLMLRGECFRVPLFEGRKLRSVVMLDPARFQHIVEDNVLVGWRYLSSSREMPLPSQVFLPEEVWHERLPNPFNWWRGMSPMAVAAVAASTDFAAGLHMKGILENNGDAGLIIRTSDQLDPEQREQLLVALRERKRRAGTADRPVLLWGGAEVISPKLSSSDMQFLKNRKFSRGEICAAFGVPEEIVVGGGTDKAQYDVMSGARLNFIQNRITPLCRRLEAAEEVTVKAIDPRSRAWFDVEDHPVLAESRKNRLAAARTGFEMGVPLNELNRTLALGFRELPWGQTGYVASNFVPAGTLEKG